MSKHKNNYFQDLKVAQRMEPFLHEPQLRKTILLGLLRSGYFFKRHEDLNVA